MSKIKVKLADGSEVEVDKPEGVYTQEEVDRDYKPKAEFEGVVNRLSKERAEKAVAKAKEEWLADPETRLHFLRADSIPLDDEGKVKFPEGGISQEDFAQRVKESLAFEKQAWERESLKPAQDKVSALTESLESTRRRMLYSDLAEGARLAGVHEDKFKPVPGMGQYSAPIYRLADLFEWDDKAQYHALKGESGSRPNPNGSVERPYIGALEYWSEIAAKDAAYKDGGWFPDKRPGAGADLGDTTGGNSAGIDLVNSSESELANYASKF